MYRIILASVWIIAVMATLLLGLNGTIDPAALVTLSLLALALFYAFALRTVIVSTREPQTSSEKR